MTPEAKVKARIKKILNAHAPHVYYCMPVGSAFGKAGVPDFICCIYGWFFAIEAKAGKGHTTALQDREIAQILESGGAAVVVNEDNVEMLEEAIAMYRRLRHEGKA